MLKNHLLKFESAYAKFASEELGDLCENTDYDGTIDPIDSYDSKDEEVDADTSVNSTADAPRLDDSSTHRVF